MSEETSQTCLEGLAQDCTESVSGFVQYTITLQVVLRAKDTKRN